MASILMLPTEDGSFDESCMVSTVHMKCRLWFSNVTFLALRVRVTQGFVLEIIQHYFFCKIIPHDFVWKDITTIWDSTSLLLDTIDFHGLRWYWIRYTKKRIDKFTWGSCSCTLRLAFGTQRWRQWRTQWKNRCWGRCRLSCRSCSPSRTSASPVLGMTSFGILRNLISHPFETTSSFLDVWHWEDLSKTTLCVFNFQLDITLKKSQ